jgi:flagellar motor switch protein FliG
LKNQGLYVKVSLLPTKQGELMSYFEELDYIDVMNYIDNMEDITDEELEEFED